MGLREKIRKEMIKASKIADRLSKGVPITDVDPYDKATEAIIKLFLDRLPEKKDLTNEAWQKENYREERGFNACLDEIRNKWEE